jgi:hypothetical protein
VQSFAISSNSFLRGCQLVTLTFPRVGGAAEGRGEAGQLCYKPEGNQGGSGTDGQRTCSSPEREGQPGKGARRPVGYAAVKIKPGEPQPLGAYSNGRGGGAS